MNREPLRNGIRRHLVEEILTGSLRPGEPIRLAATAERIGVSMTPLRESLVQLERDGFIECDPGRGYAVAELDPDEIRQLYPLIWTLETFALRSDPPRAPDLDRLEGLNERFGSRTEPEKARRLDLEWHATLLSRCRNELLLDVLSGLKTRAARYELAYMRETGNIDFSARQHATIVQRLRAGELGAAAEVLEKNWRVGPEVLLPWLERRTGGDGFESEAGASLSGDGDGG